MEKETKNNLFGSYLKDYLEEKGISNKQVQEDLNVSQQYVSGIVTGKKTIGKKLAKKLSELYGLDEGILLTGNLDKSEDNIIWTQKKEAPFEKLPIEEKLNKIYFQNQEKIEQDKKIIEQNSTIIEQNSKISKVLNYVKDELDLTSLDSEIAFDLILKKLGIEKKKTKIEPEKNKD